MLSALVRILFGVDMALGCFNYVAWSWIAGQRFSTLFLFLSIFSTHFPDADMIPYLFLRGRYRLVSHWVVGHHPLLLLPFVAVATFAAAKMLLPDRVSYTFALITSGVSPAFFARRSEQPRISLAVTVFPSAIPIPKRKAYCCSAGRDRAVDELLEGERAFGCG